MTNVQVTNLYDLQDRRIMMEKKLPPYGYALLLIVAAPTSTSSSPSWKTSWPSTRPSWPSTTS